MLEMLYATGLRVPELVGLLASQVNLIEGVVRVIGKGDKERLVPLGEEAIRWINRFIAEGRPDLTKRKPTPVLFPGNRGEALTRQAFWHNIYALCAYCGYQDRTFTAHAASCVCDTFA